MTFDLFIRMFARAVVRVAKGRDNEPVTFRDLMSVCLVMSTLLDDFDREEVRKHKELVDGVDG